MKREPSSISLATRALEEAEELLAPLSYTPPVRAFHRRLGALKTVIIGILRQQPRLTEDQLGKLASDAIRLAQEVAEFRRL